MVNGTVKFFNSTKGFGFIQPEEGGDDIFVHISALEKAGIGNLTEGDKVEFTVVTNPKDQRTSADDLKKL